MTRFGYLISVILLFAALATAAVFAWATSATPETSTQPPAATSDSTVAPALESSPKQGDPGRNTYTDPVYGFSFNHPEGMIIQTLPDPDGYLVLAATPNTTRDLQIFVTPIRTDIELTDEIIRAEISQTILGDIEHVTVGRSIPAFRFLAEDPSLGQTLEVLFTDQLGNLYQVTTYPETGEFLQDILKTWHIDPNVLFPS